jgi:hypothetical protein
MLYNNLNLYVNFKKAIDKRFAGKNKELIFSGILYVVTAIDKGEIFCIYFPLTESN